MSPGAIAASSGLPFGENHLNLARMIPSAAQKPLSPSGNDPGVLRSIRAKVSREKMVTSIFNSVLEKVLPRLHSRIFWGDRMMTLDKNAGFLDDPQFTAAYQAIRGSHIYDGYGSPHTIAWRLHTLVWAARQALPLQGDFVECGVFKGDLAWVVMQMVNFREQQRRFYLYDTFAGFSPKYSSAADYTDKPLFMEFAHKAYNIEGLYESVRDRFADMENVSVVQGIVPDVFAQTVPDRIAFMHIDLNSPAAEIGALEVLFDRVVPGGVIVFDDYGWYLFRKQKEAEDAFMKARGYEIMELPTGQGLLVKRA
jgi:O-methyltransferase